MQRSPCTQADLRTWVGITSKTDCCASAFEGAEVNSSAALASCFSSAEGLRWIFFQLLGFFRRSSISHRREPPLPDMAVSGSKFGANITESFALVASSALKLQSTTFWLWLAPSDPGGPHLKRRQRFYQRRPIRRNHSPLTYDSLYQVISSFLALRYCSHSRSSSGLLPANSSTP